MRPPTPEFPASAVARWFARARSVSRLAALALAASLAYAAPAQAQAGEIAGTVTAVGTGELLAGAQITVEGTTQRAVTDDRGRFRITGLTGTAVTLEVRRIGYRLERVPARVGQTNLGIALMVSPASLEAVVVTGTAGATERRAIGNAVTTIQASEVAATQPVRSFQDLLTGRATGVSVVASSGQVGTGSRIRVRGASSLSLINDPLIYVDGVRVDNTQGSGPTNQAFGSRSVSRWNDFDPDDIESIEVIKGPAAATLYGTEASNGVIQILTKRGVVGQPVWTFTARMGANWIPNWRDGLYTNYGTVPRVGGPAGARDTVTLSVRQLNDSLRANFGHDIFRTGRLQDLQVAVSGGTTAFRYYVAGNREDNQGVERENSVRRTNVRGSFTVAPFERWDVEASVGYTTGRTVLPWESGGGGATWGTYFSSPTFLGVNGSPQLGFRSGPPDIYYQAIDSYQDVDRFTGGLTLNHRPAPWFTQRVVVGRDRLIEDNQERAPRNDILGSRYAAFSYLTGATSGYIVTETREVVTNTVDYAANVPLNVGRTWRSITSAGAQYYGRQIRPRAFYADSFAVGGVATLSLGGRTRRIDLDDLIENNTIGGYVQEQLIWNNRLYITGAIRADDNSSFGANFDVVTYPKLSVSYVLSEEPRISLPSAINTLRLRAAYGGSGLQPGAFDAIRTYSLTGTGGTVTPFSPGNPDLGPERSTEIELGLDAGLLNDRFGAEITYFDGTTRDAILARLAPPSNGFPDFQFFNAGRVDRRGLEWLLRAQALSTDVAVLDLTLSGSTNKYVIKSLGGTTDRVSLSSVVQHVVGYSPGAWWDRRVVSAEKDANNVVIASSLMCDDGAGGTVACAQAPRVFLGNSVPTYEGSFNAGLTLWRDIRIGAFFDWRGGYKKLDGNRRVRCNLFSLCRENWYPAEFDAVTLAEVQGGTAFTYNLIRDASFRRFRELAVTYTLPQRLTQQLGASRASVTLAGRNLALWTNYPGLEPEASFNSGTRGGAFGQWEQNVLPQPRQFVTTLNLSF
ncbi:MAG: SusC/RagA family TonB-linked outer membrane protein [Gemmatimonadaceae bacterium]